MKYLKRMLALMFVMLLPLPVLAAEGPASPAAEPLPFVRVWGAMTRLSDGMLLLETDDESAPYQEIILHVSDSTCVLDASGTPVRLEDLQDGEILHAWIAPAVTLSLPPQSTALAVLANLPADSQAPEFYEIAGLDQTAMIAIYPPPPRTEVNLPVSGGGILTVPVSAQIQPYRTRNIVTVDDLLPGSQILVWRDDAGAVSRVLLLPYGYRGHLGVDASGRLFAGGETLAANWKEGADGLPMLPLRAAAEVLGLDVTWAQGKGAVVSQDGTELLSVLPGAETALLPEGEVWPLFTPCVMENGVTYLSAYDLEALLHVYLYQA